MRDERGQTSADSLVGRRNFLRMGAAAAVSATILDPADLLAGFPRPSRHISFHNINTGERFSGEYWSNGRYLPDALREINRFLRDWRTGDVHWIDPRLLDVIYAIHSRMGVRGPFEVVCGYRSPRTNAIRYAMGSGVAKNSFHMKGQALDLRLPGVELADLHDLACNLRAGGVGYYPHSNFIHVDTGPVRYWGASRYHSRPYHRRGPAQPLDLPGETSTDAEAIFDVQQAAPEIQPISRSVSRPSAPARQAVPDDLLRSVIRDVPRKPDPQITVSDDLVKSWMRRVPRKPGVAQIASNHTSPLPFHPGSVPVKPIQTAAGQSAVPDRLVDAMVKRVGPKPMIPDVGGAMRVQIRLPARKPFKVG